MYLETISKKTEKPLSLQGCAIVVTSRTRLNRSGAQQNSWGFPRICWLPPKNRRKANNFSEINIVTEGSPPGSPYYFLRSNRSNKIWAEYLTYWLELSDTIIFLKIKTNLYFLFFEHKNELNSSKWIVHNTIDYYW